MTTLRADPGPEVVPGACAHGATAVVPVKRLALAKTRLALPAAAREALALAFALDVVTALRGSPLVTGVLVVTADPRAARRLRARGARVVDEEGDGLAEAVRAGVRAAAAWRPASGVAVVPADLPCLRAGDVTRLLGEPAPPGGAFVPDRSGTGTTVLLHPPGGRIVAHYGPGSAARHRSAGLRPRPDAPVRARHDVDTVEDLRSALAMGAGPETTAAGATAWVEPVLSPRWRTSP